MNLIVMAAKLSHQKVPPTPSSFMLDHAVTRTGTNGKMLLLLLLLLLSRFSCV